MAPQNAPQRNRTMFNKMLQSSHQCPQQSPTAGGSSSLMCRLITAGFRHGLTRYPRAIRCSLAAPCAKSLTQSFYALITAIST